MRGSDERLPDELHVVPLRKVASALGCKTIGTTRRILRDHGIPIVRLGGYADGITLSRLRQLLAKAQSR